MNDFDRAVAESRGGALQAERLQTLQVNLGRLCNLSCRHCHVGGSPIRSEVMTWPVMEQILALGRALPGSPVDITGGAPEMNPHFRPFVEALVANGHPVQVRTNLTVFFEPGMEGLPEFYRRHKVALVASLPCYLSDNVDAQRGKGVYGQSVEALRQLNALGFGRRPELQLSLVYNPGGPFLPPDQAVLEAAYRRELRERFGIDFTSLFTITNMPIGRFLEELRRQGRDDDYRLLLAEAFNPGTLEGLMCRRQVSIDWDGTLYDCDFNLSLGLPLSPGLPRTVAEATPANLTRRAIRTGEHCFGCTAGTGSSCGGALVA